MLSTPFVYLSWHVGGWGVMMILTSVDARQIGQQQNTMVDVAYSNLFIGGDLHIAGWFGYDMFGHNCPIEVVQHLSPSIACTKVAGKWVPKPTSVQRCCC